MKFIPITLLLFGLHTASFAQPYFCDAPDSILARYRDDADRLAIDRAFRNGSTWTDSVHINPEWAQTTLGALAAVYNSVSPARDSVVDLFDIHVFPWLSLRSFIVSADTALPWVQQLHVGSVPTGDPVVDQLMTQYDVVTYSFLSWFPASHQPIVFNTGTNWNMMALSGHFAQLPGVAYAEQNGGCCDGSTITDSVYTDHVRLTYSYGWGDCPAGCTARHFWEFNVYPDCGVDYAGSHGTPIFIPSGVEEAEMVRTIAWPNPAHDLLHVDATGWKGPLMVFSLDGRALMAVPQYENGIDVRGLLSGVYLLRQLDRPEAAPLRFEVMH